MDKTIKKMPIEDKILLVMEVICYLSSILTLIAVFSAINERTTIGTFLLIIGLVGLVSCGLSARASRETRISGWKLDLKIKSRKIDFVKLNQATNYLIK